MIAERPSHQPQVYAIHHHYYIWDRQKKALAALVVASLVSFLPAMYLGLTGMLKFRGE